MAGISRKSRELERRKRVRGRWRRKISWCRKKERRKGLVGLVRQKKRPLQ